MLDVNLGECWAGYVFVCSFIAVVVHARQTFKQ